MCGTVGTELYLQITYILVTYNIISFYSVIYIYIYRVFGLKKCNVSILCYLIYYVI